MSKALDKYLQDTEQCHALELNYFDDNTGSMTEELILEDAEQTTQSPKGNPSVAKQKSIKDIGVARNVLESQKLNTSHTSRQHSQIRTHADEQCQQITISEDFEQDTDAQDEDGKHSVEDVTREPTLRHPEQPHTMFTYTDEVIMPTEKIGYTLVTNHLTQFLEDYPPSSDKQAFLDIYHMLSLLDKYLHDNPTQHTHCISSDNEDIILMKYTTCLNIDLTVFPTLWAVLSILLDTQDDKCEYIKCLQEGYNIQYEGKSG